MQTAREESLPLLWNRSTARRSAARSFASEQERKHLAGPARPFAHGAARPRVSEVKIIRNPQRSKDLSKQVAGKPRTRAAEVSASEAFGQCVLPSNIEPQRQSTKNVPTGRPIPMKGSSRIWSGASSTRADNEQWLSSNHDKTVHALERPSAASVPTMRYLLRTLGNSTNPYSLLKAAKL
jgi:hypothetical protein